MHRLLGFTLFVLLTVTVLGYTGYRVQHVKSVISFAPDNWVKIRRGMSSYDVEKLLGRPEFSSEDGRQKKHVASQPGAFTWHYGFEAPRHRDGQGLFAVVFREDRVLQKRIR